MILADTNIHSVFFIFHLSQTIAFVLLIQVESILFPDMKKLSIRTVHPNEFLVTELTNEAKAVFHNSTVGPMR